MHNRNLGICYIILSAFGFATMSVFIQLSGDLPVIQKCLFRNLVALGVATLVLLKSGGDFSYKKCNLQLLILRAIAGTFGIFFNFYAIEHMILSDANMIGKLSPFFVIIFSYFILKERVEIWQGLCVLAAFIGAAFIVKPEILASIFGGETMVSHLGSVPAIIGVLGAMSAGFAYTTLRLLAIRGERGAFIVFFFSAFSTVVCLPFVMFNYVPMTPYQWCCLVGTGIFASVGQFGVTAAYANAPAKEISIFDYSQIVFAGIYGLIFFEQMPSIYSLVGYLFIVVVAVYMFKRGKIDDVKNS